MSQISAYLFLKADGQDVAGEPTVHSMADMDVSQAIECLDYDEGIVVGYDSRSGRAQGDRTYEPICITKWVDRSSPILAQAATTSMHCQGEFRFFRPIDSGGGWEHFFTVAIEDARIQSIRRMIAEGEEQAPLREKVSFVFGKVRWEHIVATTVHEDDWRQRQAGS